MDRTEFERRAAEMKARNMEQQRQYRNLPSPRSVFDPPLTTSAGVKVHIRDFLPVADLGDLRAELSKLKKARTLETDRDGLLNIREAGVQLSVSPELLLRAIKVYDAVLKGATEQGWQVRTDESSCLKLIIHGESLQLAVTEKTDPIPGIVVRPGERRPRRPAALLVITLTEGYRNVSVSDKRGKTVEGKLTELFSKAEALAAEIHAENQRQAELKKQRERGERRQWEWKQRIACLDSNEHAWRRAKWIRAYVQAIEDSLLQQGPVLLDSDAAKWLKWARRYADSIDPTRSPIKIAPQEFWE